MLLQDSQCHAQSPSKQKKEAHWKAIVKSVKSSSEQVGLTWDKVTSELDEIGRSRIQPRFGLAAAERNLESALAKNHIKPQDHADREEPNKKVSKGLQTMLQSLLDSQESRDLDQPYDLIGCRKLGIGQRIELVDLADFRP